MSQSIKKEIEQLEEEREEKAAVITEGWHVFGTTHEERARFARVDARLAELRDELAPETGFRRGEAEGEGSNPQA